MENEGLKVFSFQFSLFRKTAGLLLITGLGLAKFTGLWHGVAVADFDGDGKPDIAASNAGRNTAYELYPLPVRLFYGDANGDGMMELAEAFADTKTK